MWRKEVRGITIERLANGGEGIAHLPDGRVLFVEGAVPGDLVDVELSRDKKTWARGKVTGIQKKSPHRIPVECEAFRRGCGGCQFWGVAPEQEFVWKTTAAFEAMVRISKVELPTPQLEPSPTIRGYRSKISFHQRRDAEGEVHLGFFATGSQEIVDVDRCLVARSEINEALEEFGSILGLLGAGEFTLETAGDSSVVIQIELGEKERISPGTLKELSRWLEQGQVVRGIEILDARGKHFVLGDTTVAASETMAYPPVKVMRQKAGLFRQANQEVNRRLVDAVVEAAGGTEVGGSGPRILELFSGSGNFSFPLLEIAESLVGVEGSAEAVEVARQVLTLREDLESNAEFRVADLFEPEMVSQVLEEEFDVLVLDPPRDGAAEVARQVVERGGSGLLLYVSCDPACLARDLKIYSEGGWEIRELRFFDMFPRTSHLEMLAILVRS